MSSKKIIINAVNHIESLIEERLSDNDRMFLQRVYADGLQKYSDRLRAIDFVGMHRVLDAGCGFGQWSLALAGLNQFVESCDISQTRANFLKALSGQLSIANLNSQVSQIYEMPYEDNYFDAIFCYGVIFLTPWKESLAELKRVLKPGGRIYVNANGLGWYIFLWNDEHNKSVDYDPKALAANALSSSLNYDRSGFYVQGTSLIIEPQALKNELEANDFYEIKIAAEGCLHLNNKAPCPIPFFKGEYGGQVGIYEVVATKY
ncbi:MAG: hypothetical protein B7Y59_12655 [Burkholderiales bacterium 35-55-47]|jgi:SAM-dependent methyltransferase|nr:MAG: hypothetical protein B7Y59_12655 [Burkholderiales bacterium 35-55-47]OZA98926.1 MAG: hypothetical protein B7X62_12640 [Burkholderiales bacterium 39-55-53]